MVIALVITVFNMMTMLHLPVCPQQKHLNTAANSLRASSLVGGGGGGGEKRVCTDVSGI